ATMVGTNIAGQVPLIGDALLRFLRGGDSVTSSTLTRFFGFHVAILPAITGIVLGLHLWLIQTQGMSLPPSVESEFAERHTDPPAIRFFPGFLLRELMGWYLALGVLAALAALFPWELGVKADPFASAPAGIKPEWYFLYMFETLKYIPAQVLWFEGEMLGILAFALGGLLWIAVPFLDRSPTHGRLSRMIRGAGVVALLYAAVMTVIAYVA
ncbi:MAG TPA: cytochrome b N-terminal domain-containing protein, partial [Anaerolineales bacterium]